MIDIVHRVRCRHYGYDGKPLKKLRTVLIQGGGYEGNLTSKYS